MSSGLNLDRLISSFPDALVILDRQTHRVLSASSVTQDLLGWRDVELTSHTLDDLLGQDLLTGWQAERASVRSSQCATKNGPSIEVQVSIAAVSDDLLIAVLRPGPDPTRISQELREANRFLEAMVENIPDMIFVKRARDLTFIRFNRAGEELLGWSREQMLGKTDHDFYPKEEADFFQAKDRETFARGELVHVAEEPITTRHQGIRWLHTKKVPVYEGTEPLYVLGISEDITERKLAEERARALERELSAVVLKANDAIVSWNPEDGTIVSWNPAAELLYGISAEAAISTSIEALVPPALQAELRANTQKLLAGQKVPITETYRLRAGLEIEVEDSLFLIPQGPDHPARIASIARDIGEIARLRRAAEILGGVRSESVADTSLFAPAMREVIDAADAVARDGYASVLLLGETGVGKTWLAQRIHRHSKRSAKPFFDINCAGLAPQLLESELFGHERGAFTGAAGHKRGLVEAADGGTLFLDEVGELSISVQAQLLTFLDEHRFRRVGGTRVMEADVRVLAATNADLADRVANGLFRKDLYYRLSVVPIRIPPMRERREEIPALARSILGELGKRVGRRSDVTLGRGVSAALAQYDWPGNLRELRNTLERALILSHGDTIELPHLPPEIRQRHADGATSHRLEDVGRAHVIRVLESLDGNRTRAAEVLGVSRSTLKRKLAEMAQVGLAIPSGSDSAT
ncbi:MAG TPA: sigma 54-interacting transcriptional regulator [Polyangia bacterium]|nr:sigma 54-interacting transcriptional regulator [Polyangia bacterium]